MSPRLCGKELEVQSYPTPPIWRPYPLSGRGRTGETRVYPPLRGKELGVQSYSAAPQGIPMRQTAQARADGLGCLRRCVGGARSATITNPPTGGPGRTGGTRVCPPICGEELRNPIVPGTHRGASLSPKAAQAGAEGLGCVRRYPGWS